MSVGSRRVSVQTRLVLTRQRILAFRRRVGGLDVRMPEGSASATRSDTPRRRVRSPSAGTVRVRRGSGRSSPTRSPRQRHAASSRRATSTSLGRPQPTGSPAGRGSRGARGPRHSPRSKDRWFESDRHSATSGCLQTTSRPCAPRRRLPRPHACYRVGDAYFLLDGAERELLVSAADLRQRLWTVRVWPGALLVDGEIRGTWRRSGHTVRLHAWAHLSTGTRDAIEAEAGAGASRSRPEYRCRLGGVRANGRHPDGR
jgi:hypothetical protein